MRLQLSALGQISLFGQTETKGKHLAQRCSGEVGAGPRGDDLGGGTTWTRRQPPKAGCLLQCFVWIQPLCCRAQQSLPPNRFLSRTVCHASALLLARAPFFFFPPNGAFALGKGGGEGRAAADLLGLGDGDDTRQPVVSRLPAQIRLQLAAKKSLPLILVHSARGDKSVGLGAWQMQSRESCSRGGLG